MAEETRKIMKCTSCSTAYNVIKLKPGVRFKCKKCQTINTIPQPPVDEEPMFVEEEVPAPQPKPKTKPVSRITRPGARISRLRQGRRGKTSRFARREVGDEDDMMDELPPQKKSNTPLIMGITAGAVVLVIVVILIMSGGKEMPVEEQLPPEEATVDSGSSEPEPVAKPPEWIVDEAIKTEIEGVLRKIRETEKNTEDYQKLRLLINNHHKPGVTALIELINHSEEVVGLHALDQVEWRTGMAFDRGHADTLAFMYDKWKKWWSSQGVTFRLTDNAEQLAQPIVVKGSKTSKKGEFKVNEALKSEIDSWLKGMRRLDDSNLRATVDKIIARGNEVIPVLIMAVGSEDEWAARYASDILIEITKREDAPAVNPMIPYESRLIIMEQWQDWWRENQGK